MLFVLVLLLALLGARPARGEEVFTGQAAAVNALDATWIPAPARRAAVCIIDTGVDVTPDTTNVVARFATDGGSGDDRNADKHGTLMAMIASAPYNGFGMVGIAPSIDVVSVRASRDGNYFGGDDLQAGMQLCLKWRNIYNIKVVSMSLGGDAAIGGVNANPYQRGDFEDMITAARRGGLNVVAAAGNSASSTADWPAGYAPTLAVAAADRNGARCAFASWGPDVDIWAPGCPLDVGRPNHAGGAAWASGSSESAALVAGVLTELRGLAPALTVEASESLLSQEAAHVVAGPYLDVGAALAGADLLRELDAGRAAIPSTATARPSSTELAPDVAQPASVASPRLVDHADALTTNADATARSATLARPGVRSWSVRGGLLRLTLRARPKGIEARVMMYARKRGHTFPSLVKTLRISGDRVRTQVFGTVSQVTIIYRDPSGARGTSAALSLRPRA